jgi:enoyl-CoA hydratase/carnithine racemase
VIRINRPEARNALNMEVRKLLAQHMAELGNDNAVRCIVLTGNDKCSRPAPISKKCRVWARST